MGLTEGAVAGAGAVVIVGTGAVEVTVDVPLASLPRVVAGQPARVTPQGATSAVDGTVRSVSLLPTSTSGAAAGSSPTYPVVVLVPAAVPALSSGARADVTLVVSTARNVLTVPSSAVTRLANGSAVVTVAQGGSTRRTVVTTGAVSGTSVQILTGLSLGQRVVLADLAAPLPTGSAATTRRFGGGAGAGGDFGGSGFGVGAGQPRG